jgi:uncharacterized membrane protein YphA (DoxX/SURF4 family)
MNRHLISANISLLFTRIIIGVIFIYSGWVKHTTLENTLKMFSDMGIPSFLTYIVTYGEIVGGILLVIGLWSCCAALFLSIIMIVAVYLTRSDPNQMFMMPLAVLAALLPIVGAGPGKYSVRECCKKN